MPAPWFSKPAIALSLLLLASPAHADEADVKFLLNWLAENTDYRDIPPPKAILFLDPDRAARSGAFQRNAGPSNGTYNCDEQTIRLAEPERQRSTVALHEMVHHAQCVRGRFKNDICGAETEAYRIEGKYAQAIADAATNPEFKKTVQAYADRRAVETPSVCR